jgi:hypothetical protein
MYKKLSVRAQREVHVKGNRVKHVSAINGVGSFSGTGRGLGFYSLLHFFYLRARDIQVPMDCIGF